MPTPSKLPNVGTDQPQWKTEVIAWAQEIDKHTNAHFLLKKQYNRLSKERVDHLFHRIWFIEIERVLIRKCYSGVQRRLPEVVKLALMGATLI